MQERLSVILEHALLESPRGLLVPAFWSALLLLASRALLEFGS